MFKKLDQNRVYDDPKPGFFKVRMVKGGSWVGAKIEYGPGNDPETGEPLDRSYQWYVEINGEPAGSPSPDPWLADGIERVWVYGKRITEEEFNYLIDDRAWAAEHAQHLPEAQPKKKVDILKASLETMQP